MVLVIVLYVLVVNMVHYVIDLVDFSMSSNDIDQVVVH